jgi:hypothetical protein
MRLLLAAMYSFSVQGRIGGIQQLTLAQGVKLDRRGHVQQSEFKTAETFGLQPVILDSFTRPMFSFYLHNLRPIVIGHRDGLSDDTSPLWLSFPLTTDRQHSNQLTLGRMIPPFFKQWIGVALTTTAIRHIHETTAHEMKRRRWITEEERDSVSAISGHSHRTAKEHYVSKARKQNIRDSVRLLRIYKEKVARGKSVTLF